MKKIAAVSSPKMLASFIDFGHELYKNNPRYVPELFIAQWDILTPGKHPFHDHSTLKLFLAYEGDKIKGIKIKSSTIRTNTYKQKTPNNVATVAC